MSSFYIKFRKHSPMHIVPVTDVSREEAVAQVLAMAVPGEEIEIHDVQEFDKGPEQAGGHLVTMVILGATGGSGPTSEKGVMDALGLVGATGPVGATGTAGRRSAA